MSIVSKLLLERPLKQLERSLVDIDSKRSRQEIRLYKNSTRKILRRKEIENLEIVKMKSRESKAKNFEID